MASQVGHSCWESAWGRFTMLWLVVAGFLSGLVGVHGMTSRSHKSGRPDLRPVYIGGLFPNASVLFPSIESAVRDINNFPSILPNHRLQFMLSETAVRVIIIYPFLIKRYEFTFIGSFKMNSLTLSQ